MHHQSTNIAAPFGKCLPIDSVWDTKSLEIFASTKRSIQCGLPCKTTSLCSGDSEIEAYGAFGYEITETSFYYKGFE